MKKIGLSIIFFILIFALLSGCSLFDPHRKDYKTAIELFDNGEFKEAADMFASLVEFEYKDSGERKEQSLYAYAGECFKKQYFDEAIKTYESIIKYSDSAEKKQESENEKLYVSAVGLMDNQEYQEAKEIFESIKDYKDSADNIIEITYIQACNLMQSNSDEAISIFRTIEDYKDSVSWINSLLYDKASNYMQNGKYAEAAVIFEQISGYSDSDEMFELCNKNIKYNQAISDMNSKKYAEAVAIFKEIAGFKDSDEKLDLCNKNIKYDQALSDFNAKKLDLAYTAFNELGNFQDSKDYAAYINAGIEAKAKKYGEAAIKYKSIPNFLDSKFLYLEYLYLYYNEQYELGHKDLTKLALLPYDKTEINDFAYNLKNENYDVFYDKYGYWGTMTDTWRNMRINKLKEDIEKISGLTEYFTRTDTSALTNVTGSCIYVNDSWAEYGTYNLANRIIDDVPLFFLADSPGKVRYVINFKGYSTYYGTYTDGTYGYETTVIITIKDTVTGKILFSKSYTAYPPHWTTQWGDVYGYHDFFVDTEYEYEYDEALDETITIERPVLSDYSKDIWPVLRTLFE